MENETTEEAMVVSVRDVVEEHESLDDDLHDADDLYAYVAVEIAINDKPYAVSVCVGVPESDRGSCRASGAGVRPYCTAWWCDSSDHDRLRPDLVEPALSALVDASYRLYRQAMDRRDS